jgi:hypothetical protein
MTMTNVDGGRGGQVQNSWETQAAEERRMDSLRAVPGAGKPQVNAKFWDVGKGAFVTSTEPNQMSKSKHQINSLAAQVCGLSLVSGSGAVVDVLVAVGVGGVCVSGGGSARHATALVLYPPFVPASHRSYRALSCCGMPTEPDLSVSAISFLLVPAPLSFLRVSLLPFFLPYALLPFWLQAISMQHTLEMSKNSRFKTKAQTQAKYGW